MNDLQLIDVPCVLLDVRGHGRAMTFDNLLPLSTSLFWLTHIYYMGGIYKQDTFFYLSSILATTQVCKKDWDLEKQASNEQVEKRVSFFIWVVFNLSN